MAQFNNDNLNNNRSNDMNYKYKLVIKCDDLVEAREIADQFMIKKYQIKIKYIYMQ